MGALYIVSTPIGNLEDMTLRALRILKEVDFILCEDTRVTKKLLDHYNIQTLTISYHQHSSLQKIDSIVELLQKGKSLALVSDAGTPGISDPGNQLVKEVAEKLPEVSIVPIPGASALTALASIAGHAMDRFVFLGFPPQKNKRKKFFQELISSPYPVVFYESPHRIMKTLERLRTIGRTITIARELTKMHEQVITGTADELVQYFEENNSHVKGEFVVIIEPR
ncbi:16S rRNA (cytidine(1402)-2'-O)-methyltransferase [Patescibacteria group bacterium]|nr:16S rRNA (cytidine(1402)-2'-O)-methyltransferase [Patescibacteria group bacterium]